MMFGSYISVCTHVAGLFFFSSRRRHTRYWRDWSSDVCSSDLTPSSLYGLGRYEQRAVKLAQSTATRIASRSAPYVSLPLTRSEERRVGKECRSRWSPYH